MDLHTVAPPTHGSPDHSQQALLERIDARLARLEQLAARAATAAETAPAVVATVTDTFDNIVTQLAADGVDVDERMRALLRLLERATAPQPAATLEALLDSALLGARARVAIAQLSAALTTTDGVAPCVGLWGAIRALGDADIQRALGLVVSLAKQLGRALAAHQSPKQLPAHASGV
ncbi:MAG: DUF1641 domain-containing protein [Polyangiales bacterium]